MIADAVRPVALAAIMGGLDTEVGDATTEVLLEAANFEPVGILRTSERLGLRTDGSNRWEKGVDPHLAEPAARLATELIVELSGADWTGAADVRAELPAPPSLTFRPERSDALIGVETRPERQREILERLGFDVSKKWKVDVPTWRARDVTREVDLVEEVARFELDRVPFTLPVRSEMFGKLTRDQRLRREVEDVLLGCGPRRRIRRASSPRREPGAGLARGRSPPTWPCSGQRSCKPRRRGGATTLTRCTRRRPVRDCAGVPAGGRELPDERWHVGGSRRRLRAREGSSRRCSRHCTSRPSSNAASSP